MFTNKTEKKFEKLEEPLDLILLSLECKIRVKLKGNRELIGTLHVKKIKK
jgi:small nuclear ribonucleoprotein (snRNP)-like protein